MLNCNSYLRTQLSKAYEAAKKVITSAEIEKDYIKMAKAGCQGHFVQPLHPVRHQRGPFPFLRNVQRRDG